MSLRPVCAIQHACLKNNQRKAGREGKEGKEEKGK
jgi:hypothetical protein